MGGVGENFAYEAKFARCHIVQRMEQTDKQTKYLVSWAYANTVHPDVARW